MKARHYLLKKKNKSLHLTVRSFICATALTSAVIAATYIQITYPFLVNPRFMKFFIYSLTMFMPLVIDILIGLAGIRTGEPGFYMISFIYHMALFFSLAYFYATTKKRKRFMILLASAIAVYTVLVIYYLW